MNDQENREGPTVPRYLEHKRPASQCSSRPKSRQALHSKNSRPRSAAASYGELYAQRLEKEGRPGSSGSQLSPAWTVSIGDTALDVQDRVLRKQIRQEDERLQQLRQRKDGGQAGKLAGPAAAAAPLPEEQQPQQPPQQQASVVRHLVSATGQGCRSVLLPEAGAAAPAGACWVTRSHRMVTMESSCILELQPAAAHVSVCIRMAFADARCVPALVRLDHAPGPAARFDPLGEIRLQPRSLRQLRHLFRLGRRTQVQRVLRVTCVGWLAAQHSGMHRVSSLLVTGEPHSVRSSLAAPLALAPAALQMPQGRPVERQQQQPEVTAGAAWPAAEVAAEATVAQQQFTRPPAAQQAEKEVEAEAEYLPAECVAATQAPRQGSRTWAADTAVCRSWASQQRSADLGARVAWQPPEDAPPPVAEYSAAGTQPQPSSAVAVGGVVAAGGIEAQPPQEQPLLMVALPPGSKVLLPAEPAAVAAPVLEGQAQAAQQVAAPPQPTLLPPNPSVSSMAAPPPPPPAQPSVKMPTAPPPTAPPPAAAAGKGRAAPPPPPPPPGAKKATAVPPAAAAAAAEEASLEGQQGEGQPKVPTPTRPMVKLFWSKLPANQVQGTVWKQLEDVQAEVDYSALEQDFAAKEGSKALGAGARAPPAKVMLLPMKRSNNVGVFLRKLRLAPSEVKASLLKLLGEEETSAGARDLTDEELAGLLPCLPTQEEAKLLRGHQGSRQELAAVEQFMLEVLDIPALEPRLQALRFGAQFEGRAAWVQGAGALLAQACQEVQGCALLTEVLKVALLVGNFLNAGNKNGAAVGFQIDALLKLKDVKSTRSRSSTLLHFLAREVSRQHAQQGAGAASLLAYLPSCRAAAKLQLGAVQGELAELGAGLQQVAAAAGLGGSPVFAASMRDFHARAKGRLAKLEAQLAEAEAAFRHLGTFLNGQRSTMREPAAFFSVLHRFAEDLEAAHADNARADAAAAKKAAAAATTGQPDGKRAAAAAESSEDVSPLRQRDNVLTTIRVFSQLNPEQRKPLLTEKGSIERLRKLNIQRRHSVAMEHFAAARSASLSPAPSPAAVGSTSSGAAAQEANVRASCPTSQLAAAIRSRPASPITVQLPLQPGVRPSSSPAAFPPAPVPLRASRAFGSALEASLAAGAEQEGSAPSPGPDALADCSPSCQSDSGLGPAPGWVAVAGDGRAQLHLSHSISSGVAALPPVPPAAAGGCRPALDCSGSGAAGLAAASASFLTPREMLGQTASQRSLALSPTSTPLAAMGRRSSNNSSMGAPLALWHSTTTFSAPSEAQQQQQEPQQPSQAAPTEELLQPQPSATPEGIATAVEEAAEAEGAWTSLLSPFGAPPSPLEQQQQPGPAGKQRDLLCLDSQGPAQQPPPAPQQCHQLPPRVQPPRRHALSASCELPAGLLAAAAPRQAQAQKKHVSFSLPCSPRRAVGAARGERIGLLGALNEEPWAGAHHESLDVERLAAMLRAAQRSGALGPEAQQAQQRREEQDVCGSWEQAVQWEAAAAEGQEGLRADGSGGVYISPAASLELLLRSVPTPRAARRRHNPQPAYDTHVQTAMAAVIASAGGSPTGPLGQALRESMPQGFDLGNADLRASWAELRAPAMPQPLGEGVRASATMLPGALADMAQQVQHEAAEAECSVPAATAAALDRTPSWSGKPKSRGLKSIFRRLAGGYEQY